MHIVIDRMQTKATPHAKSCVLSCDGLSDGNYISCKGCDVYVVCTGGQLSDNQPCIAGMVFDSGLGTCFPSSQRCGEWDTHTYILPHTQIIIHTQTRAPAHPHAHTHTHTRAHASKHARTHARTHELTHARTHTHTHTYHILLH